MNKLKFNSQICTTKEQSKRLLDLGLKPETADCTWAIINNEPVSFMGQTKIDCSKIRINGKEIEKKEIVHVPAWSLHRLKCLLPTKIPYESGYLTTEIINNVNLMFITETSEQRVISFIHENLYESMIKCIKWIISNGYFDKEYLKL
ncbi:MAG: hypothetical protein IJE18_06265 [Bacteroidaceae bacterium]|nr:hypothetical protein [Bacteroidaceae bacterium]MBQ3196539.1 hypothetical protein [Alistipes sp.]